MTREKEAIGAEIAVGLAELDRGEGIPGDIARARMQQRKEALMREQQQ